MVYWLYHACLPQLPPNVFFSGKGAGLESQTSGSARSRPSLRTTNSSGGSRLYVLSSGSGTWCPGGGGMFVRGREACNNHVDTSMALAPDNLLCRGRRHTRYGRTRVWDVESEACGRSDPARRCRRPSLKAEYLRLAIVKLIVLADKCGWQELHEASMVGYSRGELCLDRRRTPLRHIKLAYWRCVSESLFPKPMADYAWMCC
ncbi:hypothetical protein CI238_07582 [Colletotrichum incanum]|uniref:Uncharacterized protein n=1 Tax=Colletotrichum incanum TaxID=1573173 RepID=A0A167C4S7_COLIC|nr:hypothetical protein CI238_07582 [Colletotrichum incanum]